MSSPLQTIDHVILERLVEAGAVRGVEATSQDGGWKIVIRYGSTSRLLAARRGTIRIFRKLETLVVYLKSVGISQFAVNASEYAPDVINSRTRPDASVRMKKTYEAADRDRLFRVGAAIQEMAEK